MEIRQLTIQDTNMFCDLIKDMYSHIENLEWFTPMPFDHENVKSMISNPRFYIIGAFENEKLIGVSSLDYKCGKLIGKINFPKDCNTDKLVEIGFNIVHSQHRGNGTMKKLVAFLNQKILDDGFEWVFSKVHKDNFASLKSLLSNNLVILCDYAKPVKIKDFIDLASQDFFSPIGKENAKKSLENSAEDDEHIIVNYKILIKKLI